MKQIKVSLIDRISLTLKVWTILPADSRTFVPVEAKPAQPIENYLNRLVPLPALVGILNPEQKRSLVMTREQPVKESSPCASNVQEAGGRRREANPERRTHCGINSNPHLWCNFFFKYCWARYGSMFVHRSVGGGSVRVGRVTPYPDRKDRDYEVEFRASVILAPVAF